MDKTQLILNRKQWHDGDTWLSQPKIAVAVLHRDALKPGIKCPQCHYELYATGWGDRCRDEPEYICRICRVTDKDDSRCGQYLGWWTIKGKLSKTPDPNIPAKRCGLGPGEKVVWEGYKYKSAYNANKP